jgi:hypothetical protein
LNETVRSADLVGPPQGGARVEVIGRDDLAEFACWRSAFANERKDRRYYEIVEDTLHQEFDYRYFVVTGETGEVRAIQPFFVLDQDLLVGMSPRIGALVDGVRRVWPRFMRLRTLMVGCAAGEGHLDNGETCGGVHARLLATAIVPHARALGASLIVLKEFPARYRQTLECFLENGFARIPSLPMTVLGIDYASFDDYMARALNSATRRKLRKKFQVTVEAPAIELSVVDDVTAIIDQIYPLYLQVYDRSALRFEKLTEEFFCEVGRRMRDKVRFFVWRQSGKTVAFAMCMINGDTISAEYIGLDYTVALDLHLYHYAYRDMVSWAITNGYKFFGSSGLNYDPKLHLRHSLDPIDLYVRHTSAVMNAILKRLLPVLEPTRYDKTLAKFRNYHELWASR